VTPTKLLVGQILIVLAIMVLGDWASTQWAAAMLSYQAQLGMACFTSHALNLPPAATLYLVA
jgi:type IV secretion system protein VirD4